MFVLSEISIGNKSWNYFMLINSGPITNPQDLEQYVLTADDGFYYCGICNQSMNKKSNIRQHVESKH